MKTIIIGDLHGLPTWEFVVEQENPDRVIFIGDYFDSFRFTAAEQMHNFKEIIRYKESGQSEVIMLYGNHDSVYMPGWGETYSGYQSGAAPAIQQQLIENKHHLQMAYQQDEFVFTHAGVSSVWYEYWRDCLGLHELDMVDAINLMWKTSPKPFRFTGLDPYGNDKFSSPIWIRPEALQKANRDTLRDKIIQVVGHTQQRKIDREGKSTGGRYYYIDTMPTSGEYMIIEDGEIRFNKV